jgi:glyoxylase-like metal-dependent hydrolase (beta-lactamase superfamily II)
MIPYVRDFDFEYGRCDQVAPLIRRVIANNPGPFTFTGTGTYIVGRGEHVAVIDPGPLDDAHLAALLKAVEGETVSHVFVTHTHLDHSPLARPFARATGATIYAARPPAPAQAELVLEEGDDGHFAPDVEIGDGVRFQTPGWRIETIATPGHATNHLCFALNEENALFSGDHVMGWSTTVVSPPDGDMGAYYASLDKVASRGFATLWPTHGPPVSEPAPFLAAYKAHRLERERQILEQLAAGRSAIGAMVPVIYAAVDRRLWPAAAHSVLAHLIHLTRTGVVATQGEPGPASDYRLV